MKITMYSDYSLRVLIYLASVPSTERLAQIKDIEDSYRISKNHLMKVIFQLGKLGYIETVRGRNGGIEACCLPKKYSNWGSSPKKRKRISI